MAAAFQSDTFQSDAFQGGGASVTRTATDSVSSHFLGLSHGCRRGHEGVHRDPDNQRLRLAGRRCDADRWDAAQRFRFAYASRRNYKGLHRWKNYCRFCNKFGGSYQSYLRRPSGNRFSYAE